MSELAKTIERLELWVDYSEPHSVPEFIADLRVLIGTAKTISRAVELLQKAQRYNCGTKAFRDEIMVPYPDGSWLRFDDVVTAIRILQEGQQ